MEFYTSGNNFTLASDASDKYHIWQKQNIASIQYLQYMQDIFIKMGALFFQSNQNVTSDCNWIYAFCTSNCKLLQEKSMSIICNILVQSKKYLIYLIENNLHNNVMNLEHV